MSSIIENGSTERITVTILDDGGNLISGLTNVLLIIKRNSDGFLLDFDDNTFKASGWTTKQKIMTELDVSNFPGVYYYDFATSDFNDDTYLIRATCISANNSPFEDTLKVGGFISFLNTKLVKLLGLSQQNYRLFDFSYDNNNNLLGATIKIYENASDANFNINEITSYTMTATFNVNSRLTSYKVVEN